MALRLEAVSFDVADASAAGTFWAELLNREIRVESGGVMVPGDSAQVGLRFVTSRAEPVGRPRLHLHLTSSSPEDQQRTVATVLRLGGRHLDIGQTGDEGFVVLADPQGNELCVIEPGNSYMAGTGDLGEVTCEGSRAAGLFWCEALGWPLVWDEDQQTAIQSPRGGTKIAWDVWYPAPDDPGLQKDRQRFDLLSADPDAEVQRLQRLGATVLTRYPHCVELADPDGTRFCLRHDR